MHKLNGKPIPGTNPVVRFRLNSASNSNKVSYEREYSVWVGDLSSDVDDYSLYRAFSTRYTSIKTAKVILDTSGFSKGYGFVRFGIEEEQKSALFEMNGWIGLGSKSLKICNAVPKPKNSTGGPIGTTGGNYGGVGGSSASSSSDYSQYVDPSTSGWPSAYDQTTAAGLSAAVAAVQQVAAAAAASSSSSSDYAAYYQQQAIAHVAQQAAASVSVDPTWHQQQQVGYQQQQQQHYQQQQPYHSVAQQQQQYQQQQHHQSHYQQHHHHHNHHNHGHHDQSPIDDDLALVGEFSRARNHTWNLFTTVYLSVWAFICFAEHKYVLDTDKLNSETNAADRSLYDALEDSKWHHIEPLEIF